MLAGALSVAMMPLPLRGNASSHILRRRLQLGYSVWLSHLVHSRAGAFAPGVAGFAHDGYQWNGEQEDDTEQPEGMNVGQHDGLTSHHAKDGSVGLGAGHSRRAACPGVQRGGA